MQTHRRSAIYQRSPASFRQDFAARDHFHAEIITIARLSCAERRMRVMSAFRDSFYRESKEQQEVNPLAIVILIKRKPARSL